MSILDVLIGLGCFLLGAAFALWTVFRFDRLDETIALGALFDAIERLNQKLDARPNNIPSESHDGSSR